MGKIMLTGDRPTGRLHVGHYVGSLKRRVELQNTGDFDEMFVMIADAQALTDNADNPEKVRQNIIEVALDYLACGLDPQKCTLFIQSQIPQLCELSFYYMNLVTVSRLQRNPTVKSEIQMRNFEASIPVGFFTYPISQAADITAFKANVVPVGEDQLPMLEQTKEIVRKFNSVYGDTLVEPEILLPENQACLRLPGTDGKAKMSKSLGNCIYLSEEPDEIQKKVFGMFTDPTHIKVSDPGKLEGNTVFTYLDAFCRPEYFAEFLPDYANLQELKDHYTRGGLGDMKVKRFLNNVLQAELEPIRNRRKEYQKDIPYVYEILKKGSEKAEAVAEKTLQEVKASMKINYFNDQELIAAQAEKFREEQKRYRESCENRRFPVSFLQIVDQCGTFCIGGTFGFKEVSFYHVGIGILAHPAHTVRFLCLIRIDRIKPQICEPQISEILDIFRDHFFCQSGNLIPDHIMPPGDFLTNPFF